MGKFVELNSLSKNAWESTEIFPGRRSKTPAGHSAPTPGALRARGAASPNARTGTYIGEAWEGAAGRWERSGG